MGARPTQVVRLPRSPAARLQQVVKAQSQKSTMPKRPMLEFGPNGTLDVQNIYIGCFDQPCHDYKTTYSDIS